MTAFKKFAEVSTLLTVLLSAGSANAGGVLGDIIEGACGGCGAGRALDQAYAAMGNPLDHAAAQAAAARGIPVSPYCATLQGVFVGPWLPVGFSCNANGLQGVVVQ